MGLNIRKKKHTKIYAAFVSIEYMILKHDDSATADQKNKHTYKRSYMHKIHTGVWRKAQASGRQQGR